METITGRRIGSVNWKCRERTLLEKLAKQGTTLGDKRRSAASGMSKDESELNDLKMLPQNLVWTSRQSRIPRRALRDGTLLPSTKRF